MINMSGKKFQFDVKDEIFQLTAPKNQSIAGSICHCCDKDISAKKNPQHCQFCGHRACPTCLHKERSFLPGT